MYGFYFCATANDLISLEFKISFKWGHSAKIIL